MDPEKITQLLDEIGKRIGPAGEYVWQAAVTFKQVQAAATLGLVAFGLIVGATLALVFLDDFNKEYVTVKGIISFIGMGVFTVAAIGLIPAIAISIPQLIAPEWSVINDLVPR